jgi:hypothetical protein
VATTAEIALQKVSLLYNLSDKNLQAQGIIRTYANKHAAMDIGVGLISLAPGAGIPAIIGAIVLQSKVIYRPMAADLAAVYLRDTDSYTDRLGNVAGIATVGMEFAQEFAVEFLAEQTHELLVDAGLGALATLIPVAGAFVGATLDLLIAQMMTWRVGTMTAIYFQNGAEWIKDRKTTSGIAKELTGGLHVSAKDLLSGLGKAKERARTIRVDLDNIPLAVSEVKQSAVKNLLPLLRGFADKLPRPVVRESLIAMGIPPAIVDAAMHSFYA